MDLRTELADPWTTLLTGIVILAAVVYAWKNALGPAWKWTQGRVHKQDTIDLLAQFAAGFKDSADVEDSRLIWMKLAKFIDGMPPNGAPSIWEMLEANEKAHDQLFEELAAVVNKLDVFILERKPNGRRGYDPHD